MTPTTPWRAAMSAGNVLGARREVLGAVGELSLAELPVLFDALDEIYTARENAERAEDAATPIDFEAERRRRVPSRSASTERQFGRHERSGVDAAHRNADGDP